MTSVTRTPVPLLDLEAQYRPLRGEILAAIARVCDSQRFIMGPEVTNVEKALAAFDYDGRRSECEALRGSGIYRGIGVAAYTHMCGMAPSRRLAMSGFDRGGWESARVSIDSSGRATIYSGSMSQGQGHVTSLSQIAAGQPLEREPQPPVEVAVRQVAHDVGAIDGGEQLPVAHLCGVDRCGIHREHCPGAGGEVVTQEFDLGIQKAGAG